MTLREARVLHTSMLCRLIIWCEAQGYEIALDESRVIFRRRVVSNGQTVKVADAMHMPGSLHYEGLAADLNLYIDGKWISDGGHPAWALIGEKWESMDGSWGGRFKSGDSNHFSLAWQGRR